MDHHLSVLLPSTMTKRLGSRFPTGRKRDQIHELTKAVARTRCGW